MKAIDIIREALIGREVILYLPIINEEPYEELACTSPFDNTERENKVKDYVIEEIKAPTAKEYAKHRCDYVIVTNKHRICMYFDSEFEIK